MIPDIIAAHKRCTNNREALQGAEWCGCFYCLSIFDPREIMDWVDPADGSRPGQTALCAKCGIDSVISLDPDMDVVFLKRMNEYWF